MLLVIVCYWLLTISSFCNGFYANEADKIKQYRLCQKLASNGVSDPGCLGFDSFETHDCRNVEFEHGEYRIVVNAHPIMHSAESWKIVREMEEKRAYRVNLTIDVTEDEYRNITKHCMALIRKWNSDLYDKKLVHNSIRSSISQRSSSILEYCPVEVNATVFLPQIDSPEVIEFQKECQEKDNNGKCDMMCRGFDQFEEKDCDKVKMQEGTAYLYTNVSKQEILRPCKFFLRHIEARYRREFGMQITVDTKPCLQKDHHSWYIQALMGSSDEVATIMFTRQAFQFYHEHKTIFEYTYNFVSILPYSDVC